MSAKGRKKSDRPIFGGQILKMRQQNEQAGQGGLAPADQPVSPAMKIALRHGERKFLVIGFSVHIFTTFGVITGLLSLIAILDGQIRQGLIWLIICQIIDGFDGLIARRFDVKTLAPQINGHTLDLVIDYFTCVVLPVILIIELEILMAPWEIAIAGLIFFTSALWFARTDQETRDFWFNGFPASWNLIIPSFIILEISHSWVIIISIFFCLMQFTTVKFPHLLKVKTLRPLTLTLTIIYFIALTFLSLQFPNGSNALKPILIIAPGYIICLAIWRTFFVKESAEKL